MLQAKRCDGGYRLSVEKSSISMANQSDALVLFARTGPVGSGAFGDLTTHNGRVLNAGASEDLCFAWSFNSGAGNAYQGGAATATFNFFSEQTAHNP